MATLYKQLLDSKVINQLTRDNKDLNYGNLTVMQKSSPEGFIPEATRVLKHDRQNKKRSLFRVFKSSEN